MPANTHTHTHTHNLRLKELFEIFQEIESAKDIMWKVILNLERSVKIYQGIENILALYYNMHNE